MPNTKEEEGEAEAPCERQPPKRKRRRGSGGWQKEAWHRARAWAWTTKEYRQGVALTNALDAAAAQVASACAPESCRRGRQRWRHERRACEPTKLEQSDMGPKMQRKMEERPQCRSRDVAATRAVAKPTAARDGVAQILTTSPGSQQKDQARNRAIDRPSCQKSSSSSTRSSSTNSASTSASSIAQTYANDAYTGADGTNRKHRGNVFHAEFEISTPPPDAAAQMTTAQFGCDNRHGQWSALR